MKRVTVMIPANNAIEHTDDAIITMRSFLSPVPVLLVLPPPFEVAVPVIGPPYNSDVDFIT